MIPAGPGGGLDGTAREAGRTLKDLHLADTVSFENVSGGGGGRAMSQFLANAKRYENALIVNSTPLIVRSLQGLFPHSYRDLTPIAGLIADYGIFVVRTDHPIADWQSVIDILQANSRSVNIGGGSVRGSLDHIVLALALEAAGIDARGARYLPYDGGGKAMLALLGGETDLLSTGLGETLPFITSGKVRVLAVTAQQRIQVIAETPTLTELGYPVTIANWRGVFAPLEAGPEIVAAQLDRFQILTRSDNWHRVLTRHGWDPLDLHGDAFAAFLNEQELMLEATLAKLGFVRAR